MGENVVYKIIRPHMVAGSLVTGDKVSLAVDQVLTQDATGTMAWLQFEAMQIPRVKVPLAVSYIDHNILQTDYCNPDDHVYLQTTAAKYGAYFSQAGNGICHQVHLERFAAPGKILLGSDSHTPTAGGIGAMAIGVGGLDSAVTMPGNPYEVTLPKVRLVRLSGKLPRPWVTAMDVILEILRRLTVKGGVGWIMEYGGEGVADLSVPERATITNMGAELGATTSIFPSDECTRQFLAAQRRERDWQPLQADSDAVYDDVLEINLSELEPMMARPHSPDNVVPVRQLKGTKVEQVCVGSCTNSSYQMIKTVSCLLAGKTVNAGVSMTLNPGSKQVYEMLAQEGMLYHIVAAGVRLLEAACGPCIGMGQAPPSGAVSIRTFNRNFKGRCGTDTASAYLCSPVTATIAALCGELRDPRQAGLEPPSVSEPERIMVHDNRLYPPAADSSGVKVVRGPNIGEVPLGKPLADDLSGVALLKVGDNITTDDIMPAGAKVLPLRSNIPAISEYVFTHLDSTFAQRAKCNGGGFVVGGINYGQGSSREHAALAPMYLGLKAVIVKSFARIHRSNLINFGILPLEFSRPEDYEAIAQGDTLELPRIKSAITSANEIKLLNKTTGREIPLKINLSPRERELLLAGGLLPYARKE